MSGFVLLLRALIRDWRRHPWQALFCVSGITIGVAAVVAIDLSIASARTSFENANQLTEGLATHRISAAAGDLPETLFRRLKVDLGIRRAAPVVTGKVAAPNGETFVLLGIDPFSDFRIRQRPLSPTMPAAGRFELVAPGLLLRSLGLEVGQQLSLSHADRQRTFTISGEISGQAQDSEILVADIAAAQALFAMAGYLSYIDLALKEGEAEKFSRQLPQGIFVHSLETRNHARQEMTRAFNTNLTALSLLALLVGVFLVYNSVSFQWLRRRRLFGLLRAIGVSGSRLFRILLAEACLLGLAGVLPGLVLGVFLSQFLNELVTGSVNTLYYRVSILPVGLEALTLLKAMALGGGATVAAVALPARRMARTAPGVVLKQSGSRWRSRTWLPVAMLAMAAGSALLMLSSNLAASFAAIFLLVIGLCLLIPVLLNGAARLIEGLALLRRHPVARLGFNGVHAHLDQTAMAVVALSVAVATALGIGLMIDSFRYSVDSWLQNYLRADIYIRGTSAYHAPMPEHMVNRLKALPQVEAVSLGRRLSVDSARGPVNVFILDTPARGFAGFQIRQGGGPQLMRLFESDAGILVSEALANRLQLAPGDSFELPTASGPRYFRVAAVYFDYSSDSGVLTMSATTWRRYFGEPQLEAAGLYLAEDARGRAGELVRHIQTELDPAGRYVVRSNQSIRQLILEVFDKTFVITDILRYIAIFIAVVGIVAALSSVQLARAAQIATLRAIGMTRMELAGRTLAETAFLGLITGLFSIPVGLVLCVALIEVINLRSFGWSMQMVLDYRLMLQGVWMSLVAAVIAGLAVCMRYWRFPIQEYLKSE